MNPSCFDDNNEDAELEPAGVSGIEDDPDVVPRVGDEYQAELPPLMTPLSQLAKKTRDSETELNMPESF